MENTLDWEDGMSEFDNVAMAEFEAAKNSLLQAVQHLQISFQEAESLRPALPEEHMARCASSALFLQEALRTLGVPRQGQLFLNHPRRSPL